jgi:hypothetical protein
MTALPRRALAALATLAFAAFTAAVPAATARAAADDLWLHVHVVEAEGATVRVNLPIAFVETAVRAIPEAGSGGRIEIDGEDFTIEELRAMWTSLGDTGEALLVDVEDDGETVQVRKSGGYLLVDVAERDGGADVNVKIPERVMEALLAGDGEELDVAGALRALAEAGEGELVAVNDRDARVRVWVDAFAESR